MNQFSEQNSVSDQAIEYNREQRWRLVLGGDQADGIGCQLDKAQQTIDKALSAVYGKDDRSSKSRRGGLGSSSPNIARWLGDIRAYFPSTVVTVLQKDAIDRLNLYQLLLEPEVLQSIEADVHMVATLITLKDAIPDNAKDSARQVVQQVVDELMKRLQQPMQQAVQGALNRSIRNHRPKLNEIDWHRTIQANIKNYLPEYNAIVPEKLIGYGRKRSALKDVILCVDQSGSMANSVVYSGIFAAVMASLPALKTQLVVFDTAIVDLTDELHHDPIDLLFGVQLGGGTDINRALQYCQGLITRPKDTVLILISDLYEGGNEKEMLKRVATLSASGVQMVTLLALDDDGASFFDHDNAAKYAAMDVPTFACTPDLFPDLMAKALSGQDITSWAAREDIVLQRGE
jgi:Mg-chelatase subunit ChlD